MNDIQKFCIHSWELFKDDSHRYCVNCGLDHPDNRDIIYIQISDQTGYPVFKNVNRQQSRCPLHCTIEGPGIHNHVEYDKKHMVIQLTDRLTSLTDIKRPSDGKIFNVKPK